MQTPEYKDHRSLVDQLISDTKLYNNKKDLEELIKFTSKLRHLAPFNMMLLHVQKPGLTYAASAKDWLNRFNRKPKQYARPLIILKSFGPVDFVFDVLDVEPMLEAYAYSFPTEGDLPHNWVAGAVEKLRKIRIYIIPISHGDSNAGHVKQTKDFGDPTQKNTYELGLNANHAQNIQFVTLLHELAHIYLGHCGNDKNRGIKNRRWVDINTQEVEAETVAYIVAKRSSVKPRSEKYLEKYQIGFDNLDIHTVLQAAGQIEKLLNLPLNLWP